MNTLSVVLLCLGLQAPPDGIDANRAKQIEDAVKRAGNGPNAIVLGTTASSPSDNNAFAAYTQQVAAQLRARRFSPIALQISSAREALYVLEMMEKHGKKADVLVTFGHGGWDGPVFGSGQMGPDYNSADFDRFTALLKTAMNANGLVVAHACHSGGSNRYETYGRDKNWAKSVAERTGLYAVGARGYTAMEMTRGGVLQRLLQQAVAYGLDGAGAPQEMTYSDPKGTQVRSGFSWMRDVFLKRSTRTSGLRQAIEKAK